MQEGKKWKFKIEESAMNESLWKKSSKIWNKVDTNVKEKGECSRARLKVPKFSIPLEIYVFKKKILISSFKNTNF